MFLIHPLLDIDDDSGEWRLGTPLVYEAESGELITVPVGFITDLASIPQIFHSLIPVNGKHRLAAILHDYLFVIQDRTRSEVDALFLEAMEAAGVRLTQRWVMYLTVRAGGWRAWSKNEKARREDAPAFLARNGLR